MEQTNEGRLISFCQAQDQKSTLTEASRDRKPTGRALILEPRTIRHQERVEDLFYLLFRRTGT